jgi:hypothetical protein
MLCVLPLRVRRVFKVLAGSSPLHVVWVFTGSRMAIFWANVAAAPVSGYSLLTHVSALHLPPRVSASVKQWAWGAACAEFGARNIALPGLLYSLAPEHHATLLFFCAEWARPPREADVAAFCSLLRTTKLYPEARCVCAARVRVCSGRACTRTARCDVLTRSHVATRRAPAPAPAPSAGRG